MTVVTRFPPSPTGFMHIGNARTAIFNWLYARHHGGKMLLRIEDTDRERSTDAAVDVIFNSLEWLGINWDGEPVYQSRNANRHVDIAQQLLDAGKAYKCYCTKEELEEMRSTAQKKGETQWYDRRWRDVKPEGAPKDRPSVIRIKAPLEGSSTIHDMVQGSVTVDNRNIDDFIIVRSDNTPTYMLSVVVDDHDMGVTDVIRGDDHLNNAFRQKVIYEAMGWDVPKMAHLPLIHGADGAKYSKRHGSVSVLDFKEDGALPEALFNCLLRLGWSHGDDEIVTVEQAIEWFSIKSVGKSSSKFDSSKLEFYNTHYIRERENAELIDMIRPLMEKRLGYAINQSVEERLMEGLHDLKQRAKSLNQLADASLFYAFSVPIELDEKASLILDEEAKQTLSKLLVSFKSLFNFLDEEIQDACRDLAEKENLKLKDIMMPLRAAITGTTKSPPLSKAAEILGLEETCHRIEHAISR